MKVYPINLNVENKRCVVIGGGKVAYRKICGLLDAGAVVEVIAPEICAEIQNLLDENKITVTLEKYSADKLGEGLILIAACDDEKVNSRAVEDGRRKNFLVNSVNDFADFTVPSKILRGDFMLTISTGGTSPAFSKFVREMSENEFDENFGEGLKIIADYRRKIKEILPDVDDRINFWREVLTPELWQLLKGGKLDELREILKGKIYELDNSTAGGD